jgi:glycosyltransferase involved in cell wall biosynthesis
VINLKNLLFLHPEIRWIDVINYSRLKDWKTTFMGSPYPPDTKLLSKFYKNGIILPLKKLKVKSVFTKILDYNSLNAPFYPLVSDDFLKEFDAVITIEFKTFYSLYISKKSKELGFKHIVRSHSLYDTPLDYLPTYKKNARIVYNNADAIIFATHLAKKYTTNKYGGHPKYIVSYLGIDPEEINILKKYNEDIYKGHVNNKKEHNIELIYVGRLVKEKGIIPTLKATKYLKDKGLDVRLTVIGDGKLKEKVVKFSRNYKNIIYLGSISHELIWQKLFSSDIFLGVSGVKRMLGFTVWMEDVGHTTIEAMGAGLPVIGGNAGCQAEIIGNAGFTVPQRYQDIGNAILGILDQGLDNFKEISRNRFDMYFNSQKNTEKLNNFLELLYKE